MARIRSRGNARTELALVRVFRSLHITGWRRHVRIRVTPNARQDRGRQNANRAFSVRPDFVFPQRRLVVFVDGCFWHGCPEHGTKPQGNAAFWRKKFAANVARDRLVTRTLRRAGWKVLRLWEHELARRREARLERRLRRWFPAAGSADIPVRHRSVPATQGQGVRRRIGGNFVTSRKLGC